MSVASNIKNSLRSSRNFLWNLRQRIRSKKHSHSNNKRAKNFTYDHGQFPRPKPQKKSSLHRLWLLPFALIVTFGGLAFFLVTLVILFFLHGVKLLWEGYNFKPTKRPQGNYRLKFFPKKQKRQTRTPSRDSAKPSRKTNKKQKLWKP